MKVIPTVFVKNKAEFDERFAKVEPLANEIQIDFMDGKLIKQKGVQLRYIPRLHKYKKKFEAHLMVANPHLWIEKLKQKGFSRVLFHIESQKTRSERQTRNLIAKIKKNNMEVGIVLNPKTPNSKISPFIDAIDVVMFMGHRIGVEHIGVESFVYQKIKTFKKLHPKTLIEVDGGVNSSTISKFATAGANKVSVGSAIASAQNPKTALRALQKKVR